MAASPAEYTPSAEHIAAHDAEFDEWLEAQYEAGATDRQIVAAINAAHAVQMRLVEATFARWREAEAAADAAPDDERLAARLRAAQRDAMRISDSSTPRPPAAAPRGGTFARCAGSRTRARASRGRAARRRGSRRVTATRAGPSSDSDLADSERPSSREAAAV